ncbi:MAG TPA: hypothetical protein DGG95_03265 [Cytophagales bacterium]|jgi:hypothetical protein|nr:hypothetical protein [Cytophagales bacterium]
MISAFEYITVFISIILGLGVTQILTGIADLVHQYNRVKVYWPHMVWIFLVLILHVQEWWITFQLRTYDQWRLPVFLFVMLYPIVLFILARLLFPFGLSEGTIDLKKFYYENYRRIFFFGAILGLLSILDNIIIRNSPLEEYFGPTIVLFCLSLMAAVKNSKPWLHKFLALFMFVMFTLAIVIQWNEWLVTN